MKRKTIIILILIFFGLSFDSCYKKDKQDTLKVVLNYPWTNDQLPLGAEIYVYATDPDPFPEYVNELYFYGIADTYESGKPVVIFTPSDALFGIKRRIENVRAIGVFIGDSISNLVRYNSPEAYYYAISDNKWETDNQVIEVNVQKNYYKILHNSIWNIAYKRINGVPTSLNPCETDDFLRFEDDLGYMWYDEGLNTCSQPLDTFLRYFNENFISTQLYGQKSHSVEMYPFEGTYEYIETDSLFLIYPDTLVVYGKRFFEPDTTVAYYFSRQ